MQSIEIHVKSPAELKFTLQALIGLGIKPDHIDGDIDRILGTFRSYPFLFVKPAQKYVGANSNSVVLHRDCKSGTLNDVVAALVEIEQNAPVEVKLNDEYSAKIENGSVQVGCQIIEFAAVEELYKAILAHKKSSKPSKP